MDIKKFGDFINEDVKIPVVDILIDENGNIYNGVLSKYPLRKGNISQVITKIPSNIKKPGPTFGKKTTTTKVVINGIVGSDSKSYPFGVDKNGYLVYPEGKVDEDGYVLNDSNEFRGGDLEFQRIGSGGKIIKNNANLNKMGTIIVFPSFIEHRITPVTKGVRYSAVTWAQGPAFK